jgi:carbon storage regulator CsrA
MLVLTRRIGESIHVGSNVEIKFLSVRGNHAQVGIQAPRTIEILRGELFKQPSDEQLPEEDRNQRRPGSRFAVLLVEDDPLHAKIIARILSKTAAADVAVASSGEEAVERLCSAFQADGSDALPNLIVPRLIMLDLRLPGMSGLDVLVRIKSDRQLRRTPVVILSSSDEPLDIERCFDAGANAFVTKSPNHDEFCASLSRIAGFWGGECQVAEKASLN